MPNNIRPPKQQPTFILIAGPSGCGKSEFINQFLNNQLPDEFSHRISTQTRDWIHIEANDSLKQGIPFSSLIDVRNESSHFLLHYDTLFIRHFHPLSYKGDPLFKELELNPPSLIVSIEPDRETLQKQFRLRKEKQEATKSVFSLLWAQWFRMPIKRAARRLQGRDLIETDAIYSDQQKFGAYQKEWAAFLSTLVQSDPSIELLQIKPVGLKSEQQSIFQLIK